MQKPKVDWHAVQTAYAAGIGLRELARSMNIPAGTIMARSQREQWTKQITEAKQMAVQAGASTTAQAVAVSLYERGQRHIQRMSKIGERAVNVVEQLPDSEIVEQIEKVDRVDRLNRRQYGLDEVSGQRIGLQINFLSHPTTEERGITLDAEVEKLEG